MTNTRFGTLVLVVVLVVFAQSGCGGSSTSDPSPSDKTMNGNLLDFVQKQVVQNGGHIAAWSNTNAQLRSSWRFRSDTNGVQIFADATFFPEVNRMFRDLLGTPDIATEKQPGQFFVGYNIKRAGVAIQFGTAPSPFPDVPDPLLHLIILKPRNSF